jgi:hypothetical protein
MTDTNKRPAEIQLDRDTAESDASFTTENESNSSWGRAPEEVLSKRRFAAL